MKKEITFDRFIRGLIFLLVSALIILLVRRLESVLLPFFVAWLLAYFTYPLVTFFQYKLRIPSRLLSIILALAVVLAAITGIFALVVPPTIRELSHVHGFISDMIRQWGQSPLAAQVASYLDENIDERAIAKLLSNKSTIDFIQVGFAQVWSLVTNAFSFLRGIVTLFIIMLYVFFILMDYESITEGFIHLVPSAHRTMATGILDDVKNGMNNYFRGQALIAFIVGILFSIGFSIIGLPMAVGLGMFIGLLNLVPYLQTIGIVPTVMLALLRVSETGENFWVLLFWCFIVFLIVQGTQDIILTPRIMGKVTGLKPAVILLSLSIWGSLMGFIGLIVALPLTTILISYYRRYLLKEGHPEPSNQVEKQAES